MDMVAYELNWQYLCWGSWVYSIRTRTLYFERWYNKKHMNIYYITPCDITEMDSVLSQETVDHWT